MPKNYFEPLPVASRVCVQCGEEADSFCARCGVTHYCSERCQRRDWIERHKEVCHNLARLAASGDVNKNEEKDEIMSVAPSISTYRQKRVPVVHESPPAANTKPPTAVNNPPVVHNKPVPVLRQPTSAQQPKRDVARRDFNNGPDTSDKKSNSLEDKTLYKTPPVYRCNTRSNNNNGNDRTNRRNANNDGVKRTHFKTDDAKEQDDDWEYKTPTKQESRGSPPKITLNDQLKRRDHLSSAKSDEEPVKRNAQAEQQLARRLEVDKLRPLHADVKVKKDASDVQSVQVTDLVPKNYLIGQLKVGDMAVLSVDNTASECRSKANGYVCLSMHQNFEDDFQQKICVDFLNDCEEDEETYSPKPGGTFSYLNPEDSSWYRARCLTRTHAALIDSCKVVAVNPNDKCKKLPPKYESIPEFCCLLQANDVQIGGNVKCTLLSESSDGGFNVSLENAQDGVALNNAVIKRWLPEVEYHPQPVTNMSKPEVSRPDVVNNTRVLLVDAPTPDRVIVRPADIGSQKQFDSVLHDVLFYGTTASPLKEPPCKGQTVIGKFTDNLHYRALCKGAKVAQNKYLLEYIEYGNMEVTTLEKMYPCPEKLKSTPTVASVVSLGMKINNLTPAAERYLDALKEEELILTIPGGVTSAPSGSEVQLKLVKNNEVLNKKLEELCTPEWKKVEDQGGDVMVFEKFKYNELKWSEIPLNGCNLIVTDLTQLDRGTLSGYDATLPYAKYVFTTLQERLLEYCNSCIARDYYLPGVEEVCVVQDPQNGDWCRAVMIGQWKAGNETCDVLFIDYGHIANVPVNSIRKMVPEFMTNLPIVACFTTIKDFPQEPTEEMLERARKYMKVSPDGRFGELKVTRCFMQKDESGLPVEGHYNIQAPGLIKIMCAE